MTLIVCRRLQIPLNLGRCDPIVSHPSSIPEQLAFDQAADALLAHFKQFGRFWDRADELGGRLWNWCSGQIDLE